MGINGIVQNKRDEYYTPKKVVDYFGKFDYDPATTKAKASDFGIEHYDTIDTNGLQSDWTRYKRIWLNPPFTLKHDFLKKARDTYRLAHNEIFVLFPVGYLTTGQFHDLGIKGTLYIPRTRIFFENSYFSTTSPSMGSVIFKLGSTNKIFYIDFEDTNPTQQEDI